MIATGKLGMIPQQMTSITVDGGKGPAAALRAIRVATPQQADGEILIRVRAAGLNRSDIIQREGFYVPPPETSATLGLEAAGEVVALGAGVTQWREGDRVAALLGGGGYADYVVADARHVLPLPDDIDFIHAAGLVETVITVFANVFEGGRLESGETILLHGATSGIGVTAIQMANVAGARVIATARGADKAAVARSLGAHRAVDVTAEDFVEVVRAEGGADLILDMVGADYAQRNVDALNPHGRLVMIATQAGPIASIDLLMVMIKHLTITGSTLRARSADEKARLTAAVRQSVWPWVETQQVKAIIDHTFPLAEAAAAHAYMERGTHVGKIILTT